MKSARVKMTGWVLSNIASWMSGARRVNRRHRPAFSTDYRMVHWNDESYKLTKKQSAVVECLHNEGGRAHKDLLRAEARTNEEIHRIMRNKKSGRWIPHPLWSTLIKSEGNGYYYLDA